MTQQSSDVSLEQVPWQESVDSDLQQQDEAEIESARDPGLIHRALAVKVRRLLTRDTLYSWDTRVLASTIHTLLGEGIPPTPPEVVAADGVEWRAMSESDRRALLDVVFRYIGLRQEAGQRLLGVDGWRCAMAAGDELVAGVVAPVAAEAPAVPNMPPDRRRIGKGLLIGAGAILAIVGVYSAQQRSAAAPGRAGPDRESTPSPADLMRENLELMSAPKPTLTVPGPVNAVCSGDELVCSSVKTAKPLEAVRALIATVPNDGGKIYRVNVAVRATDTE